jgi:diadenylate cyclase
MMVKMNVNEYWTYIQDGWRPALEIFILAVTIYFISRFLRGTRGWPVVIGFVVALLVLFATAEVLNLMVLRWLLGAAYTFFAFAVLIIFQPELRRLLAELGNLPLFASIHEQRENIEVIIQTVERLSEVKIGALIAIEQSIHLHDAVESGVLVDCQATPEMLETIFFPNNAIHDGGVIIKGDRIAYAACIFPLTQRTGLAKSLGTRHRAAIGLSEETDAVIVVVSEENGMVSHAYKGQLVRGVTAEELRSFLTSVLLQPDKPHSPLEWIRRRFAERNKAGTAVITKHVPPPSQAIKTKTIF